MRKRVGIMNTVLAVAIGIVALGVVVWIGLQVKPAPFPALAQQGQVTPVLVELPADLPPPVTRFYRHILGVESGGTPQMPVVETAIISGRAKLRVAGIPFPSRFRFVHRAGQDYRHYLEATIFGLPVMRVNEHFIDGQGRMELPVGVVENEPAINQAANLGLWAETLWLPSLYLTDPRVRWEAVDDETALLVVPFGPEEERFVVRFDPETGLISLMESMRYKNADDLSKTLWLNQALAWETFDAWLLPARAALIWLDDGTPWAVFEVEEVIYNSEIDAYILARGP